MPYQGMNANLWGAENRPLNFKLTHYQESGKPAAICPLKISQSTSIFMGLIYLSHKFLDLHHAINNINNIRTWIVIEA